MMKIPTKIVAIFTAATLPIFSPIFANAQSAEEVGKIATEITVRIDGEEPLNKGSGVIVAKEGNNYTVLTNCHVVDTEGNYTISTFDNQAIADFNSSQAQCHDEADLAVVQFSSNQNYPVATVGNSTALVTGSTIYIAGWTGIDPINPERGYRFKPATVE